ncbi:MAG: peptide ligase PGM1-related protein [Prochlorothrix sp.]|nr:peptide ligase PGM1-related protein [Prochlorothrix sp.]
MGFVQANRATSATTPPHATASPSPSAPLPTADLPIAPAADPDAFQLLQQQLRDSHHLDFQEEQASRDILVIPSISLDVRELAKVEGVLHYEERMLCDLIQLRNPHTRLIYVTSQPLPPIVVDYYLQLLPGIPFSHARNRLLLLSVYDNSLKPLTQKILERPRLVQRIANALRPGHSVMTCYNATTWERELSVRLGVPLFAADPHLLPWGTKYGSRTLFAQQGIPHPPGTDQVWTAADLAAVAADLWEQQPQLQRMVIKLNEGFSGEGNALLDLRPLADVAPGRVSHRQRAAALANQFRSLRFQAAGETWDNFGERLTEMGAIAEAFVEGEVKRSPSVQGYISPGGSVEVLSTHDQVLGGPDQQVYLGCKFPADPAYRLMLQTWGKQVGEALAAVGALERYGVDFVVVEKPDGSWLAQAIEINLRKGGTTHPFMTLKYLTNGSYSVEDGGFYAQTGQAKYYVATDNLQQVQYQGLLPEDLIEMVTLHQLHFDSSTKTGTIFHLMGCLSEFGKLGLTSIGNSLEEAEEHYQRAIAVLDQETREATLQSSAFSEVPIGW